MQRAHNAKTSPFESEWGHFQHDKDLQILYTIEKVEKIDPDEFNAIVKVIHFGEHA